MARAGASGNRLKYRDVEVVLGMLNRGDRQHDIAAYFGVNGGRIGEISTGDGDYPSATPANEIDLPPPGPYLTRYALEGVIASLNDAIEAIDLAEAEKDVADVKAAFQLATDTLVAKIKELKEVWQFPTPPPPLWR